MTHRRTSIRTAAAAALAAAIPAVNVYEESIARVGAVEMPLIIVAARAESLRGSDGTMGAPEDRRELTLTLDMYAEGENGKEVVDLCNLMDELAGAALAAANTPGGALDLLVTDLRWSTTTIITNDEQEKYLAVAAVEYLVLYDVFYGSPI